MNVAEVLKILGESNKGSEMNLCVVDLEGRFYGVVKFVDLLLAKSGASVRDIITIQIPRFFPETPIKNLHNHSAWIDFRYIPVLDQNETFLGLLSYKTLMEETKLEIENSNNSIKETGEALGELFNIGLTGLFRSVGKK